MLPLPSQKQNINTNLRIKVSAPGKVILHGEHSVVYGKLAIAASLGLRTKTELCEIDQQNAFIIQSSALNFNYTFDLNKIKAIFGECLPLLVDRKKYSWENPDLLNHDELVHKIEHFLENSNVTISNHNHLGAVKAIIYLYTGIIGSTSTEIRPLAVTTSTDLTTGAGMGSSASFSVCIAASLIQYVKRQGCNNFSRNFYKTSNWDIDLSKFNKKELDLICQWSFCAEKIIHGTPSGLDNTICTYGSMVEYRIGTTPKLLNMSNSLNLLLINTKVPRETKKLVAIAASYNDKFPDVFSSILDAVEAISIDALKNYEALSNLTGDEGAAEIYENLCLLFSVNHSLLNSIGVGHSKLNEITEILAEVGLKGKLTGAGGGGYAICLIPPNFNVIDLDKTIQTLISRGFEVLKSDLGVEGVKLDNSVGENSLESKY